MLFRSSSETVAACFRGVGIRAESLPSPDAESLRFGRRHTSGKECLPLQRGMAEVRSFILVMGRRKPRARMDATPCSPPAPQLYIHLHAVALDGVEEAVLGFALEIT